MRLRFALVAIMIFTTLGCSLFKNIAEIESTTSWSCACGNRTVDGTGNQSVDLGRERCAVVQKQTRNGVLTLTIGSNSATTIADFGVVSLCKDSY